jgi:hypothetical protein
MKTRPIRGSGGNDLPLEDKLAIDRTFLANEKTLLAYLRTGAALLIAGVLFLLFLASKLALGSRNCLHWNSNHHRHHWRSTIPEDEQVNFPYPKAVWNRYIEHNGSSSIAPNMRNEHAQSDRIHCKFKGGLILWNRG